MVLIIKRDCRKREREGKMRRCLEHIPYDMLLGAIVIWNTQYCSSDGNSRLCCSKVPLYSCAYGLWSLTVQCCCSLWTEHWPTWGPCSFTLVWQGLVVCNSSSPLSRVCVKSKQTAVCIQVRDPDMHYSTTGLKIS